MTPLTIVQTSAKVNLGQSNPGETKSRDGTTPELGPAGLWSPQSSTFSGTDSIVSITFYVES